MITALLVISLVILAVYIDRLKRNVTGISKIPGPPTKPFIGNVLDVRVNGPADILIKFKELTKVYGAIVRLWIGSSLYILTSEPKYIGQLLMGNYSQKSKMYDFLLPFLGYGLVTSSGEKWKTDRRLLSPYFNNRMVAQFTHIFNKSANNLVDKLKKLVPSDFIDLTEIINDYTFNNIVKSTMGVDLSLNTTFYEAINWLEENTVNRNFSLVKKFDWLYRFTQDYRTEKAKLEIVVSCIGSVISNQKQERFKANNDEKKTTILDALLDLSEQNEFTDKDIQDHVVSFIVAGYDTVAATINYGLFELAKHSDVQQKILDETNLVLGDDKNVDITFENLADLEYTDCVFKEIMRVFSTVPMIERELVKEVHFDEHTLPKGTTVILFLGASNANANNFYDSEKFIPERFFPENAKKIPQHAFTPFSEGARNCVGQHYGTAEAKLLLAKVVRNFRIEAVQPDHIPQLGTALVMKSGNGLPIKLRSR